MPDRRHDIDDDADRDELTGSEDDEFDHADADEEDQDDEDDTDADDIRDDTSRSETARGSRRHHEPDRPVVDGASIDRPSER